MSNVFHLWANGRCILECEDDMTDKETQTVAKLAQMFSDGWMIGAPMILPTGWRLEYHPDAPARFPQTVAR